MVENGQKWTMTNGGQGTTVDNGQLWTMNNGEQWTTVDNLQWWKWWTMDNDRQ